MSGLLISEIRLMNFGGRTPGSDMQEFFKRTVRVARAVANGLGLGYPGTGLRVAAGGWPEGGR